MKSSDLLIKCLENEGVEYVFGVPGEEILDTLDSLSRSRIKFIPTRHEQGAAFMADCYGRLTGKAGVCLSTLGPGAMNMATAIADANLDHSPIVAITGQAGLAFSHTEYHQYIDIVHAFGPITKWNTRIDTPSIIPQVVKHAFSAAESEKRGATHLEFPHDIAEAETDASPITCTEPALPIAGKDSLKQAAELINGSKNPIIIAGNGVIRTNASISLRELMNSINIPVATTFMGKGAVSAESDLYAGTIGLQAHDHISCGFDRADLVIAIGYDFAEYSPSRWNASADKTIVHIDSLPAEIEAHYAPSAQLVGDIACALQNLIPLLDKRAENRYYRQLRELVEADLESHAVDKTPKVAPQKIVYEMRRALGKSDILISDVGAHKLWIARMYPAYESNTVLISNGFASMGFAVPAAVAAKLVHPNKRVLAACGDSGFLMNVQELETAERLGLKIVYLIFNDYGFGLIKWKQMGKYNREFGVSTGNPDFVKLAESFGLNGFRVENAADLASILSEAFESEKSAVIDVPVDYSENYKLSEKLGQMICPT